MLSYKKICFLVQILNTNANAMEIICPNANDLFTMWPKNLYLMNFCSHIAPDMFDNQYVKFGHQYADIE